MPIGRSRVPRISLEHLWVMAVLVGIFAFANTHPVRPHDFWWHMAVGKEIVATQAIPTVDAYSYTAPGSPYPSYQTFWLMEVLLYEIYKLGGPILIVLFQSLMITLTYSVILYLCRKVSGSWRIAAFGTFFAACLGFEDWNVRPQVMGFLLGALFLLAIYQYRIRPRKRWLVVFPVGMVIWANSHPTFLVGLGLTGLWLLDEIFGVLRSRRRAGMDEKESKRFWPPLVALSTAAAAAILASPRGIYVTDYLRTLTGRQAILSSVIEWVPPSFTTLGGILFFAGLLLSAAILILSPRKPTFFQVECFLSFAVLSLRTSRGVVWYGLAMAPILSRHVAYLAAKMAKAKPAAAPSTGSPVLNAAFASLILLMGVVSLPWFKPALPLSERKTGLISMETPVEATQFLLDERLPAPIFHAMAFGSYLIWAAEPEYKVFVDGRIGPYSQKVWNDYLLISTGRAGWEKRLEHYGVKTLMLSPGGQPALIDSVKASPAWRLVYEDRSAVIFTRK